MPAIHECFRSGWQRTSERIHRKPLADSLGKFNVKRLIRMIPIFPLFLFTFWIPQILAEPDDGWNKVKDKDGVIVYEKEIGDRTAFRGVTILEETPRNSLESFTIRKDGVIGLTIWTKAANWNVRLPSARSIIK